MKSFLLAGGLVLFSMPTLIAVARRKRLVDEPEGERKLHTRAVPTIGGVAVFFGLLTSVTLFLPDAIQSAQTGEHWGAAISAFVVLFFLGLKDDLVGLSPSKKLLVHLLLGGLLIFEGGFRITTFNGLFGIEEIPFYVSSLFSLFVYIVVVNAMNLIDGVDGLAGGFGAISSFAFGLLFASVGQIHSAVVAFALCGALLGFLRFNWYPANIFLGDGGSLPVGLLAYVFAIECINLDEALLPEFLSAVPAPVIAMTLLAYPLVDTLRVFTLRIKKGRSPFAPDRNHLHHRMMALGWGHQRTSLAVHAYTLLIAGIGWGLFAFVPGNDTVKFVALLGLAFGFFTPILRKSASVKANRRERLEKERHHMRHNSRGAIL